MRRFQKYRGTDECVCGHTRGEHEQGAVCNACSCVRFVQIAQQLNELNELEERVAKAAARWLAKQELRTQGKPEAFETRDLRIALRAWLEQKGKL